MEGYKLLFVPSDAIDHYFDVQVAPRLISYCHKFSLALDCELIRQQLKNGEIYLSIILKNAKIISIAITQKTKDFFSGAVGMHIIFLHADRGEKILDFIVPTLEELAAHFGLTRISADTIRGGWARIARKFPQYSTGWVKLNETWVKTYGQ